jgi:hypothetical protein
LGRLLVASERPIFLSTGKASMAERALAGLGASRGAWWRGTGRRRPDPRYTSVYTREATGCIVAWNREAKAEMAEPEINAFLTHLAVKEKVSAST